MSITVFCQTCGSQYSFPDSEAGEHYLCSSCKATLVVPTMDKSPTKQSKHEEMMDCPFCAEPVKKTAKKCKHCGETIDVALRVAEDARRAANNRSQPNVYMNAGGGASSSSSSSSSAAAAVGSSESWRQKRTGCLSCFVILLALGCCIPMSCGMIERINKPKAQQQPVNQPVVNPPSEKSKTIVAPVQKTTVSIEINGGPKK
jgi:hypothetical protein